jgi:hypothetical protein
MKQKQGHQRAKPQARPSPQMPNPLAMGLDLNGLLRGSVDDGQGRQILEGPDKPNVNSFVGRQMRGDFRKQRSK